MPTFMKSRRFSLLAVLGVAALLPLAAEATELDGLWGSLGSRYYGFAITEDASGRVSIRDSRGPVARGFRNGYRIELRSTDDTLTRRDGAIAHLQRQVPWGN